MLGRIDGISGGIIRAWAWDPARPGEKLAPRFVVGDEVWLADSIRLPRKDLMQAGIGDGSHGYRKPIPHEFCDNIVREVRLEAPSGEGAFIVLDRKELRFPRKKLAIEGRVEGVRNGRCVGWVVHHGDASERLSVVVKYQGRVVSQGVADRFRRDLLANGIGDGEHGFELFVPNDVLRSVANGEASLAILTKSDDLIGEIDSSAVEDMTTLLDQARRAERAGDFDVSARLLDRVIAVSPDEIDALWLRARIAASRADKALARQLAERALAIEPGHSRARVILARILFDDREFEGSLALWSGIGRSDSAFRESILKSGKCLAQLKRPAEVIRLAREALALNPSDAEARRLLLDSYLAIGCDSLALDEAKLLAATAPDDKKIITLLDRLQGAAVTAPAVSPSIVRDPDLRDWNGRGEQAVSGAARVSRGVTVSARTGTGVVNVRAAPPAVYRADSLPSFGLELAGAEGGFDVRFDLSPEGLSIINDRPDFYFEARSRGGTSDAKIEVSFGINGPEFVRRRISEHLAVGRARLLFFQLALDADELKAVADGIAVLEFHFSAGSEVMLYAPRPFGTRISSQP